MRAAVDAMALTGSEDRGAVFTKREVVDFILDLVGYQSTQNLLDIRLLEPSFGGGDFLFAAVDRLLASTTDTEDRRLDSAICAIELHHTTFENTKLKLQKHLIAQGVRIERATQLVQEWLIADDFLLTEIDGSFDIVVGNPPYVRQERIPEVLIAEYRRRYATVFDRADLYVPFIERSLSLLSEGGALGFICADRWMKNRYGGPLRKFVLDGYHLRTYVDMVDTLAFHTEVIAYPAIFVIAKESGKVTRIARRPIIERSHLKALAEQLTSPVGESAAVTHVAALSLGDAPWLLESDAQLDLVRRLENSFPSLAEAGCTVGIGVATGADKAFIAPFDSLDVESDRKLPLVMTKDILTGTIQWKGFGVVNPFAASGGLVKLEDYPRLRKYLNEWKNEIAGRHVAKKTPSSWYRTIDRIYPALVSKPKLLIPDIKGEAHIVYDEGKFYPHHNLYYITSDEWNLLALQRVLCAGIANLFVSAYSTKMRGGYLRYQAQYLRRIRIPQWHSLPEDMKSALSAVKTPPQNDIAKMVAVLFDLSDAERDQFILADNAS